MSHQIFMKRFVPTVVVLALTLCGCGPNVKVSGKVRFENGTPLDKGIVVFQSPVHVAKGKINSNGRFVIGSTKPKDGLPPGKYKVYIVEADTTLPHFVPAPESDDSGIVSLVDTDYCLPDTTPLEYEITKRSSLDIKVKPSKYVVR